MKFVITVSIIICGFLLSTAYQVLPSTQQKRIALVIGNGDYKSGRLKNPVNDAEDIAAVLTELGFSVVKLKNARSREMKVAIREFGRRLKQTGGTGIFYFAGHGVQVGGRNYLIPVGAVIESESDVEYESVDAGRVLGKMEDAGNPVNIVILDACRENPFARSFRTETRGLTRMDAPTGSFVAFATAPGATAADGDERNGTFTKYLLRYMGTKGLTLNQVLMRTRKDVIAQTNRKQVPWESSSLTADFYFVAKGSQAAVPQPVSSEGVTLPKESQTSFDDMRKASEKKRQAAGKWYQWQQARQHEYLELKDLDADEYLTPEQKVVVWKRFLAAVSQDNPYSEVDEKMRSYSRSRVSFWGSVKSKPTAVRPAVSPGVDDNVAARDGTFVAYTNGVVYDEKTGLEWYAGPDKNTNWFEAKRWVESLAVDRGDWRMPTLNELKGLYQQDVGRRNLKTLSRTNDWLVWSGVTEDGDHIVYALRLANGKVFRIYPRTSKLLRAFAVRSRR